MNTRTVVAALAWFLAAVAFCGVLLQREELMALRAQREQTVRGEASAAQFPVNNDLNTSLPAESVSPELLRLRREVTRLSARKRELASVTEDAERLRARLAAPQTNSPSGISLPPGYIRKADAQFVGYSTPENTMQSFLWAVHHHDVARLLEVFSPTEAQSMRTRLGNSGEPEQGFFKALDQLPGMAFQNHQDLPDGSVELQMEIGPGVPPQKIHLRPFNGEWKLDDRL
jgi:hypothetical protein